MFRKVIESATLLIKNRIANEFKDRDIINFGFGQSPFLPPNFVVQELKLNASANNYTLTQGDKELRMCMSEFHKDHNGLDISPDDILVGPGSKILIFNLLLSFDHADVFIPAPSWVSYAPQTHLAGHNIITLTTDYDHGWRINIDDFKNSLKKKIHNTSILILNYPGNPDGLIYTEDKIMEISKICREYNVFVISDEIYGLLTHDLNHLSFSNYYPERTITITGLSKWCGAGGWRLGAAFISPNIDTGLKETCIGISSETYSCASSPIQKAALAAYGNYESVQSYIEWQVTILREVGIYCYHLLSEGNIRVHKPQGGFYLFPDFMNFKVELNRRNIVTSSDLCNEILNDTGVALLPASNFGFHENYFAARLAYVDFEPPLEYEKFDIKINAPKVIEGINRLIEWFHRLT